MLLRIKVIWGKWNLQERSRLKTGNTRLAWAQQIGGGGGARSQWLFIKSKVHEIGS